MDNRNGTLKIIPCTHKLDTPIRARYLRSDIESMPKFILDLFSKKILIEEGDAVIFHENLIHGSDDNLSSCDRLAVSLVLFNKDVKVVHYIFEDNSLKMKEVKPDFFFHFGLNDNVNVNKEFKEVRNVNTFKLRVDFIANQIKRILE